MRDIDSRVLWSGAILLAVGLSMLLLVGEWFAAFDACLANPTCAPPSSLATMEGFLAVQVAGVAITVLGTIISLIGLRRGPLGRTPGNPTAF
jgi:hypothetical protein